jgi:hypothetical protein
MRCIVTSPRVYRKLMAEIDNAAAAGKIPSSDKVIPNGEALDLPYLQACIKEVCVCEAVVKVQGDGNRCQSQGLRWYPGIAGMLAKKACLEERVKPKDKC